MFNHKAYGNSKRKAVFTCTLNEEVTTFCHSLKDSFKEDKTQNTLINNNLLNSIKKK